MYVPGKDVPPGRPSVPLEATVTWSKVSFKDGGNSMVHPLEGRICKTVLLG